MLNIQMTQMSKKTKHNNFEDDELEKDDKNYDKIKQVIDKLTHIFTGTNLSLIFFLKIVVQF